MVEINDANGNLLGVTGLRQLSEGTDEWTFESVTGWVVYGNKFVLSMDGIEITLSAEAAQNILDAILEKAQENALEDALVFNI